MNADREAMEVITALTAIRSRNEDTIASLRRENHALFQALEKARRATRIARHRARLARDAHKSLPARINTTEK